MIKNGHNSTVYPATESSVPKVPFARRRGSSFGVEVLELSHLRARARRLDHSIYNAHRIEFHILFVVTGGPGRHMVDFQLHPAERGTLIWIAPGQIHRYDDALTLEGYLVLFQPEVCGIKAPNFRWPASFEPPSSDFELLESLTRTMLGLEARNLTTSSDRLAWRMLSAVLEIWGSTAAAHLASKGNRPSREFEAFDALLEESFSEHRDLSWYARRLACSEKTLSRWCRRSVGIGAKAHIDQRVALEAKRLLVHTRQPVERIAMQLGFSESTNFVKFFKRIEGATPSRFRESYR